MWNAIVSFIIWIFGLITGKSDSEKLGEKTAENKALTERAENAETASKVFSAPNRSESDVLKRMRESERG